MADIRTLQRAIEQLGTKVDNVAKATEEQTEKLFPPVAEIAPPRTLMRLKDRVVRNVSYTDPTTLVVPLTKEWRLQGVHVRILTANLTAFSYSVLIEAYDVDGQYLWRLNSEVIPALVTDAAQSMYWSFVTGYHPPYLLTTLQPLCQDLPATVLTEGMSLRINPLMTGAATCYIVTRYEETPDGDIR